MLPGWRLQQTIGERVISRIMCQKPMITLIKATTIIACIVLRLLWKLGSIHGRRSEPKKIALSRELIVWE